MSLKWLYKIPAELWIVIQTQNRLQKLHKNMNNEPTTQPPFDVWCVCNHFLYLHSLSMDMCES